MFQTAVGFAVRVVIPLLADVVVDPRQVFGAEADDAVTGLPTPPSGTQKYQTNSPCPQGRHRLNRSTDQRLNRTGGHNLLRPQNQQHNQPGPRKTGPYGVSFYPKGLATLPHKGRGANDGKAMQGNPAKSVRATARAVLTRPLPPGSGRRARRATSGPSLHASNAAQAVAIQMSHSFRRNERQEASKNRQHPITKQTHRVPTDSNQSTYDPNARTPRQINVRPAPRPNVPNSAHRGTFWDMESP